MLTIATFMANVVSNATEPIATHTSIGLIAMSIIVVSLAIIGAIITAMIISMQCVSFVFHSHGCHDPRHNETKQDFARCLAIMNIIYMVTIATATPS